MITVEVIYGAVIQLSADCIEKRIYGHLTL